MTSDTHSTHKSGGAAEPERPRKTHATKPAPAPNEEPEEPVEVLIRVPLHDEPEVEPAAEATEPVTVGEGTDGAAPAAEPDAIDKVRSGPPPEPDAASRVRFARLLLRSGSLAQARSQYEALAATEDLDPAGLLDLAEVRWRTGDLMGAGSAAAAYVSGGGDQVLGFLIAAEAAAGIGRQVEARRNAEMVEKQAPDLEALFAGVPRRMNWSRGTILPPVAIQIEVPAKPETPQAADQPVAPLPPAETLWQQIEEVAVAAEKAAAEKAAAEKAEAEKAEAHAGQAPAEQPAESPPAEQPAEAAAVAEPVEPPPDQALELEKPVEAEAPPQAVEPQAVEPRAAEAEAPPQAVESQAVEQPVEVAPVEAAPEPEAVAPEPAPEADAPEAAAPEPAPEAAAPEAAAPEPAAPEAAAPEPAPAR